MMRSTTFFDKQKFLHTVPTVLGDDSTTYEYTSNITLAINRRGDIIELDERYNKLKITKMRVKYDQILKSSMKVELIPMIYRLWDMKLLSYPHTVTGYKYLSHSIQKSFIELDPDQVESNGIATACILAYYEAAQLKDPSEYYDDITDITDSYVSDVITREDLYDYIKGYAASTNTIYGFLDYNNKNYATVIDDYGNVEVLKYTVTKWVDEGTECDKDVVRIDYKFTHVMKVDEPAQISDYLNAFKFLACNPTLFPDINYAEYINNVDRYDAKNNTPGIGTKVIPPLYSEIIFKKTVTNKNIKFELE